MLGAFGVAALLQGCEYDSWFDPSRTGYFEHTPTSIPVLRRIDVIEVEEDAFATEIGPPTADDLKIGAPEYIFAAGDDVRVLIKDLFQADKDEEFTRTIDPSGKFLLPVAGYVQGAGLTQSQLVDEITNRLRGVLKDPRVDVTIVSARAYTFTVDGFVRNPGVYSLNRPDFDVEQAVALAGGADQGVKRVRIVRVIDNIPADATTAPGGSAPAGISPAPGSGSNSAAPVGMSTKGPDTGAKPSSGGPTTAPTTEKAPDIDDLINQLKPSGSSGSGAAPAPAPAPAPAADPSAPAPAPVAPAPASPAPSTPPIEPPAPPSAEPATPPAVPPSPGALRTPVVDIDAVLQDPPASSAAPAATPAAQNAGGALEAPKVAEKPAVDTQAAVATPPKKVASTEAQYVFDTQKQEWVLVQPDTAGPKNPLQNLAAPNSPDGAITGPAAAGSNPHRVTQPKDFRLPDGRKTRVIVVDWPELQRGDVRQRVIIRPGDKVHVETDLGVVYIDGEVSRPGVYNLPIVGELTLSRLVSAAGGLGQIAIPERCDLVRRIAPDREAAIRVNLAAIRNRAEPDIVMRCDDHVIIGTNFIATPLAVIRNGFRMTYGFGFLLDRNFGNDVFGPPPESLGISN
ncbi:MAG: SLBB domain-containing protein [Phycisphaerales bacterium]